jgi:hypothetical protein
MQAILKEILKSFWWNWFDLINLAGFWVGVFQGLHCSTVFWK